MSAQPARVPAASRAVAGSIAAEQSQISAFPTLQFLLNRIKRDRHQPVSGDHATQVSLAAGQILGSVIEKSS